MSSRPSSVVAERAVRYLHESGKPASSVHLAREVLSLAVADEEQATLRARCRICGRSAPRVRSGSVAPHLPRAGAISERSRPASERAGHHVRARCRRAPGGPRAVRHDRGRRIAATRRRDRRGVRGRSRVAGARNRAQGASCARWWIGARIVLYAPPAGLGALESWIEEPLVDPLPLALLARRRLRRPALHTMEDIAAALGLAVRVDDDPLRRIELLPACFDALRTPGEAWEVTFAACHAGRSGPPWPRYAFSRDDLQALPPVPGTYRFYDLDSKLLYVGKSNNLKRRLAAWFGDEAPRGARGRAIVEAVHRFEVRPSGSDLEALLREAAQIRSDAARRATCSAPSTRARERAARLRSILILEPAEDPWVLRAWLIREGQLLDSVPLGPRGGGLRRIERVFETTSSIPAKGRRRDARAGRRRDRRALARRASRQGRRVRPDAPQDDRRRRRTPALVPGAGRASRSGGVAYTAPLMDLVLIVVALVAVAINAFFVATEFAIVRVRVTRIEELVQRGVRRAVAAREVLREPRRHHLRVPARHHARVPGAGLGRRARVRPSARAARSPGWGGSAPGATHTVAIAARLPPDHVPARRRRRARAEDARDRATPKRPRSPSPGRCGCSASSSTR